MTHQGAGGESFVSDDSLDTLLNSDPVIDSIANVVVAKTNSQILNVVFAHTEKNHWNQLADTEKHSGEWKEPIRLRKRSKLLDYKIFLEI